MTKQQAKELLPVIEAFANGKIIEYFYDNLEWRVATCPNWDTSVKYRIKPEPKLVPFTFEDNKLFRDKWMRQKGSKINHLIRTNLIEDTYIVFNEFLGTRKVYFLALLNDYEFEDSSPCGKYINE